jgi:hypothetical protein
MRPGRSLCSHRSISMAPLAGPQMWQISGSRVIRQMTRSDLPRLINNCNDNVDANGRDGTALRLVFPEHDDGKPSSKWLAGEDAGRGLLQASEASYPDRDREDTCQQFLMNA